MLFNEPLGVFFKLPVVLLFRAVPVFDALMCSVCDFVANLARVAVPEAIPVAIVTAFYFAPSRL